MGFWEPPFRRLVPFFARQWANHHGADGEFVAGTARASVQHNGASQIPVRHRIPRFRSDLCQEDAWAEFRPVETMMTEFPETRSTLLCNVKSPDNREAWEEFVELYRPVIYRMARHRGLQDADGQDLAQDVLVRVSRAIDGWEKQPGTRFRHWLRKVANNAILSALTRLPRDAAAGGSVARDLLDEHSESSNVQQELERECLREQYLRAAAIVRTDVSQETWRAFELTVIDGFSSEDAAEMIGKSLGTVYAARSRIMKRLRNEIQRMEGQEK